MSPVRRGGLYRRLAIPLSVFVLIASLGMVLWISFLYRRESLRRFERVATTNADFMSEVPLPKTGEMAERLSSILDVEVAFHTPGQPLERSQGGDWPADLEAMLADLEKQSEGPIQSSGFDLAIAPLGNGGTFLILSRPSESGLSGLGGWVLVPTLFLTAACGVLVLFLAHRIVRPLTALTGWLPNLKHDEEATEAIPASLSERGDEIGLLAHSLEQTHQRLLREQERRAQSERLATLGRIATSLAHEIRNPAAAIRMHADLLAQGGASDRSESIGLIGEEVDRITDLVNQWLFVARAAPPETKRHDLCELLRAVERRLQPAFKHAGVRLDSDLPDGAGISCDRLRIEQVIRNLLVNAMQAMPKGGEVACAIEEQDGEGILTVQDQGSGFSDEALQRFGEPFFSEREGGMGIGLTLAREVVQAHGGTIAAHNREEGGAVVRVSLPAAQTDHLA